MERLYEKYVRECACHMLKAGLSYDEFVETIGPVLAEMTQIKLTGVPGQEGVLYFDTYQYELDRVIEAEENLENV